MKLFDTDWERITERLEAWERLTPSARAHYLLGTPSVPAAGYGDDLPLVLESGLAETVASGNCRPTESSLPFRSLMAHLSKFPLFDQKPTRQLLEDYIRKHYVREESEAILDSYRGPPWDSMTWPNSFLKGNVRNWEKPLLTHFEIQAKPTSLWSWPQKPAVPPKTTWFADSNTAEAAKILVRAAKDNLEPLLLHTLPGLLPEELRPSFDAALRACLRFMLLYPALRRDTLSAVIGLCPVVAYARNRPPAVPPAEHVCAQLYSPAYLLEDMSRVLAEAAGGDCRLNKGSDGSRLFRVIENRLIEELVPLPEWLQNRTNPSERLSLAISRLAYQDFAHPNYSTKTLLLEPTREGRRWLSQPPAARLRELLRQMKKPQPEHTSYYDDGLEWIPGQIRFGVDAPDDFDHHPWIDSIWRQAGTETCVAVEDFLDYYARTSHPFVSPLVPEVVRPSHCFRHGYSHVTLREENVEELTRELLELFFWERLVPLGCVETGLNAANAVCFRLSAIGRYAFSLAEDLAYGQATTEGALLVQPNFEIVFLHPDLNAEVDLSPFSERCGKGVGTLFRLTRRQAFRAAGQGHTADAVIAALAKHSAKPIPDNVQAELRSWFGACRTLTTRRAMLIEAGTPELAVRVQRLLGKDCQRLSHTLLEFRGQQIRPPLRKKLSDQGLFFEAAGSNAKADEPSDAPAED